MVRGTEEESIEGEEADEDNVAEEDKIEGQYRYRQANGGADAKAQVAVQLEELSSGKCRVCTRGINRASLTRKVGAQYIACG